MITKEEKDELVNRIKEEIVLSIPDMIGNLIREHAVILRLNSDLYGKHPDFAKRKDIVGAVVEAVESDHPGTDYEEILKLAVPKIKEQIKSVSKLDVESVLKPNMDDPKLRLNSHGDL